MAGIQTQKLAIKAEYPLHEVPPALLERALFLMKANGYETQAITQQAKI